MKVICTQENLKSGLVTTGRIISSSNTLPILNNVFIKTENGLLKISSTNLEIAITTSIRCKIETEGEVTVSSKTLMDLISNLPNKNITLEKKDTDLLIESENYHTKLKTLPTEDFPIIPTVEQKDVITVDSIELKKSLEQVVFAASTNQTQPEISGVLFSVEEKILKIVATDRYRLAEKKVELVKPAEKNFSIIIPQKTTGEIIRVIGPQKGVVEIIVSETQIAVMFNDTQIVSRLVDGQYPDYKQIIPNNFLITTTVAKTDLVSAIKTTSVFGQLTSGIHLGFSLEKQQINLFSGSTEVGDSSVEVNALVVGGSVDLVLNYKYLLDCLNSINTEKVLIKIVDDNSPSILVPENESNYVYLIMPIKG